MPLPTVPKPWSFYRLGPTKEKELFKRHRDTYDGVVIPAHIASYYCAFCSEFVGTLGKPYFIDPITYIFANNPTQLRRFVKDKETGQTKRDELGRKQKGEIRRSFSKLIGEDYQGVVKEVVDNNRPLVPGDFADAAAAQHFVHNILNFQRTRLAAIPDKFKKYAKYAKRAGANISMAQNPPMCLVAPYFPSSRIWHPTNVQLFRQARAMAKDIPLFAVILGETQVLAQNLERIAADYMNEGVDGFLLWPDGFSGEQDSAQVVFNLVADLNKYGRPVILMYGDAFSLALHFAGLAGFACGICYGERKLSTHDLDVEGAPPPRYYIKRLKKKMVIETELRRIQLDQYPDLRCNCDICRRKPDPATLDDSESREHFMLIRAAEIAELRAGMTQANFAASLTNAYQEHSDDPLLRPINHLDRWASILSK